MSSKEIFANLNRKTSKRVPKADIAKSVRKAL